MHQVKLFKSIESELESLQEEINTWLKESRVNVVSVSGNIAPQTPGASAIGSGFSSSDILVIVLYERRSSKKPEA